VDGSWLARRRRREFNPMRYFLNAVKLLLLDLASTILFIAVFLLTHNTYLSIGLGVALGVTQIGIQFARRKPIETMEPSRTDYQATAVSKARSPGRQALFYGVEPRDFALQPRR
jgi:hypothetical protein